MSQPIDIEAHKIMSMEPEKRGRIINAALEEFRNGFHHASTDHIVREAGISKGLLFHYFGTKEGLYSFLLWYAFDVMVKEYIDLINYSERDIIERLRQMVLLKQDLAYKHPNLSDFLLAAYTREREDPSDQFSGMYQAVQADLTGRLYENVDRSLFRDDVDAEKAINIIQWSLFGYSNSKIGKDKTIGDYQEEYGTYLTEIDGYFKLFRQILYKEAAS
ncbi:MAG: TetR/AcrR family transcriptional regulator [Oscillospiraceae bacterium]|nr:TetR/AcrR family transcriptional regulator [Oscillospiraceae bacterium]